ncbi:hypothetical protein [Hyphomicrobium sp.]|uniref:hypothetical protein n=1 Tax=Hyphomicrobium sp. TaxID=82 RepID=UPI0025BAAE6F|nr:hypothetical protein [Hyphomicrobium sp.]MCC7251746.1 hypothetical protein [Hyphomicrobium sp.]
MRARRAALGLFGCGALVLASEDFVPPASGGEAGRPGLTIGIVDLAEIPELAPRPPAEVRRPAWRTSFGSERQTEPEIKAGGVQGPLEALAGCDVVLIQGVRAAAPLRRLFPPSAWRLIVSRRVLSATDPVGFRSVRSDLPPTTAIAIKARQDLHLTARTYALRLEVSVSGPAPERPEAAATAVRLVDRGRGGRTLWLASVALPPACSAEDPPCTALETLDAWRQEKLASGEPTVIGGRMGGGAPAETDEGSDAGRACGSHTIDSDLAWQRLAPSADENSAEIGKGCISIVRLAD